MLSVKDAIIPTMTYIYDHIINMEWRSLKTASASMFLFQGGV